MPDWPVPERYHSGTEHPAASTTRAKLREAVDLARGYAVPDAPGHINVLACAVLALHEKNERLSDKLDECKRWHDD